MKTFFAILFLILAAAFTHAQPNRSSQVDEMMAPWSGGNTPGVAVIVIKDGEVLHKKGYGVANLDTHSAIDANTIFNTASVAKQFTAMAVMMLAERGKLGYSDPVTKYIPESPEYARQITIRHLLNHTSGLADYTIYWDKGLNVNKPGAAYSGADVIKFLAGRKKLEFSPGENWRYSNSGYVLLTEIVAKVSGVPFPQFVKENIFRPLEMNDSYVYDTNRPHPPNLATGYMQSGKAFKKSDHNPDNFITGDDDLFTTVVDMAKWDQALYTEKLVKTATLAEAFTSGTFNDGTKFNYGFGWAMGKYLGLPFVSHSGGTSGFIAHIARFPAQRFTVVLLSNFEQIAPSYSLANKIAGIYLADKLVTPVAIVSDVKKLKDYAGNYEFYDIAIKIAFENDALWITTKNIKRSKLVLVAEDEFIAEGSSGETCFGFKRNTGGVVTGVSLLNINGLFLKKLPE